MAEIARTLFPYKPFLPLRIGTKQKSGKDEDTEVVDIGQGANEASADLEEDCERPQAAHYARAMECNVPDDGNRNAEQTGWTKGEHKRLDIQLRGYARWEVDYDERTVKSTTCSRQTMNESEVCDNCCKVEKDPSLKDAVHRVSLNPFLQGSLVCTDLSQKYLESQLPEKKQHEIFRKRLKFSPGVMRGFDNRALEAKLQDPLLCGLFHDLQRDNYTGSFLRVHKAAVEGKITQFKMLLDICTVFVDHYTRSTSDNAKAKHGIRYPPNFLNWMLLLRGYGGDSARQYAILSGQIPAPSARHLRYACSPPYSVRFHTLIHLSSLSRLVANSKDALQNPDLIYENVARIKRFLVSVNKPDACVVVAIDCTKSRPRLSYSNAFGSHVLGSTLPLEETVVKTSEDIDIVVNKIKAANAVASQVRVVLVKVSSCRRILVIDCLSWYSDC